MTPVLVKERPISTPVIGENILSGEVMALCPSCKAFQSLWVTDGRLVTTRKFRQIGGQIFHDCGSVRPCHLYHVT